MMKEINENKVDTKLADRKPTQKFDMNRVKTDAKKSDENEKRIIKELEMKMAMIMEVVNSEDKADMKIGIIRKLLD